MRSALLTACLSLASVTAPHAEVPQPSQTDAVVVTIDVTVTDRNGRFVTGLAAADFQVELDKRARPILTIAYLAAGAPMSGGVGPMFDAVTPAPAIYRIAVAPPEGTPAGAQFSVAVVVSRPGTRVQVSPRAVATPAATRSPGVSGPVPAAAAARSVEERLRNAIATGRPERALPLRLGRALRRGADPTQVSLEVQIEIPAAAKAPLSARLGVVDSRGAIRSAGQEIDRPADGVYRLDFSLPLAPGSYKLRFAAADAAGTIGAIETAVSAELASIGPFAASDLLRWTAGAGGKPHPLFFDDLPSGAVTLGASLELYGPTLAGTTGDLLVKMTLGAADKNQPASIERVVSPEIRDGVLVAEAEFPLDRVGSGTYMLQAVVQAGTSVLGTTSATVIKR